MYEYLQDPVFYWLIWAIFTVSGIILGWSLRAAYPEKEVIRNLERTEQERNTLARLYTHLKHQHDLREADFKRVNVEAGQLRLRLQNIEEDEHQRHHVESRAAKAEELSDKLSERLRQLETHSRGLSAQNARLNQELNQARQELEAWQTLYKDFQHMQQRLTGIERHAQVLEAEKTQLQKELEIAKLEVARLQKELQQEFNRYAGSADYSEQGGPATAEQDDFTLIEGIHSELEKALRQLGVLNFEDISQWDDDAIINIARQLNISPGKIYKEDWVGQAKQILGDE